MTEIKKINNLSDCLSLLGSNEPFKKQNIENPFDDCLTKSGYVAYDQLRELLFFLSKEKIIPYFDEDNLDRYVNYNY